MRNVIMDLLVLGLSILLNKQRGEMDISSLKGTFLFLLILQCGDVEPNPGPPQEKSADSEVLRQFTRCIQSELVKLIYSTKDKDIPNPNNLYKNDPPGWNSFKKDIKFESVQKCGSHSQSFDKLVELVKKELRTKMPTDIADVLNCYEKLKLSNKKTDEAEKVKFKTALENYVSRNRALKNRQTVLDNLDEELLIEALQKATEKAIQSSLVSSDGFDKVLDAINNFVDAVEQLLLPTPGEKRGFISDKIQQVKKRKTLVQCRYKGKGKLPASKGKQCKGKRNAKKSHQTLDVSEERGEPIATPYFCDGMQTVQLEQTNSSMDLEGKIHTQHQVDMSGIEQPQDVLQDHFGLQLESPPHHQGIQDDDFDFQKPIPDIGAYTEILTEASQERCPSDNLDLGTIQEPVFNSPFVNNTVLDIPLDETNYFSSTFVSVADYTQVVNIPTTVSSLLSVVESPVPTLDIQEGISNQHIPEDINIADEFVRFISSL
ncbi:uncharacterized protein LOC134229822 [Saccostrea cucullata]|uniref:uncharacterized protein LOC134229822 n=1 Tax=Saccostrea cuccullata TaxID=36930 RepID=UPI002ED20EB5